MRWWTEFVNRLLRPLGLDNTRGQLNLAGLLSGLLGAGGITLPTATSRGGLDLQKLLGGGLFLGGALADKEPGEVLEARQALRTQFAAPYSAILPDFARTGTDYLSGFVKAPADPFATGGTYARYLPALEQTEADARRLYEARLSKAYPTDISLLAQGPVQRSTRRLEQELVGNRQKLIADLIREQQGRQQSAAGALLQYGLGIPELQRAAARDVLQFSRPDPTAGAISQLGALLLMDRLLGGGGQNVTIGDITAAGGAGGAGGAAQGGVGVGGPGVGVGGGGGLEGLGGGGLGGAGSALSSLLGSLLSGGGNILSSLGTDALAAIQRGLTGQGALGPAGVGSGSALLSSLGAGAGGYVLGKELGGRVGASQDSQALGAGTGAATGAAAGFALGGPPGAAIGAIAGGLGGFGETRKQQHATKAARRASDVESQRDQVIEEGNVGAQLLQQAGVEQTAIDRFQAFADAAAARSAGPGNEQGEVAVELNRLLTAAGYPAGQRPPEWRRQWIDYMIANTFTEGGGPPRNLIEGEWGQLAGFKHGGLLRSGSVLVGEDGMELLTMMPSGALVLPLHN